MRKLILFLIIFSIPNLLLPFEYWVPYVDTVPGASGIRSSIFIHAFFDGTNIDVDFNHDGIVDANYTLQKGEELEIFIPDLIEGTNIISNNTICIHYYYSHYHHGLYEDGDFQYVIPSGEDLGTDYWYSGNETSLSILSTENNNSISINGVPQYTLNRGDIQHIYNITQPTHITSTKKIMVVAVNYAADRYGNTYAYTILPNNRLGTFYYVPAEHGYNYNNDTNYSRIEVIATQNGTNLNIAGNNYFLNAGDTLRYFTTTETVIQSNKPILAIYISDIYAQDPWAGGYRHYTYAFPLVPSSVAGNKYNVGKARQPSSHGWPMYLIMIASLENSNTIALDAESDGTVDSTIILQKGEYAYISETDFQNWNDQNNMSIESTGKIQVIKTRRGWWSNISESTNARAVLPVTGTGTSQPFLYLSNNFLNFGAVSPGNHTDLSVTLTNTGNANLTISSTNVFGPNASDFSIISGGGASTLTPSASKNITVRFSPQSSGSKTAYLIITSNTPSSPDTVALLGTGGTQPQGLIAYYPFNGNVNDESGNNYHGALLGAATVTDILTIHKNNTDALKLPGGVMNGLTDFTIAAILKIDESNPGHSWISCANPSQPNELLFSYHENVYPHRWQMLLNDQLFPFSSNSLLDDMSWHHAAVVREGSTAKLYIDGQQVGPVISVSNTSLTVDTNGFIVGQDQDYVGGGFDVSDSWAGKIDELRIYDYALTEQEIQSIYQGLTRPGLNFSNNSLNFGTVSLGNSSDQSVTLTNTGNADLIINTTNIAGPNASDFSIISGGGASTLTPSASKNITVRFSPQNSGSKTAYFIITSNAPSSPDTVALTGLGSSTAVSSTKGWKFKEGVDELGNYYYPYASQQSTSYDLTLINTIAAQNPDVLIGDIDGDQYLEIVTVKNNTLKIYNYHSSEILNIDIGTGKSMLTWLGDVDGDGLIDIGIGSTSSANMRTYYFNYQGNVIKSVSRTGGTDASMWPVGLLGNSNLILAYNAGYSANPRGYAIYDRNTNNEIWFYDVGPGHGTTSIADIDHDGKLEFCNFAATWHNGSSGNGFNGNGTYTTDGDIWCIVVDEDGNEEFSTMYPSPSNGSAYHKFVDFNNDGYYELIGLENHDPTYYPGMAQINLFNISSGQIIQTFDGVNNGSWGNPAFVDVNNDGYKDIIVSCGNQKTYIVDRNLNLIRSASITGKTMAACDINGNGEVEFLLADQNVLKILDVNLNMVFTYSFTDNIKNVMVADIDLNQINDIVVTAGSIYILETGSGNNIQVVIPNTPVLGSDVQLTVNVPQGFSPTIRRLYYRQAGKSNWHYLKLSYNFYNYIGSIPQNYITYRGVEYYVYLSDGQATYTYPPVSPQTNPAILTVQVPNINCEFELNPAQYKMFCIPLELNNTDLLNLLYDDYGQYNPINWRVFFWDVNNGLYQELQSQPQCCTPGKAFWLITRQGNIFDVDSAESVPTGQNFTLTLQPGWNQIGNPFAFPVAWDSVVNSNQVQAPVKWNGNEYEYNQTTLLPWEGYFVYNPAANPVQLSVPPRESQGSLMKITSWENLSEKEFILQLKVKGLNSGLEDDQNFIGMLSKANDDLDCKDLLEAPPIGDYLQLSIIENDKFYMGNFKSISQKGSYWDLRLSSTGIEEPVLLFLDKISSLPTEFQIWLLDKDKKRIVPIKSNQAEINVPVKGKSKHFRLIVGTKEFANQSNQGIPLIPLQFDLGQNYPNPFNPETHIFYKLAEYCRVRLEIYNILGEKIRTLINSKENAGIHSVVWNGRDDSGNPVASGIYLYRLNAGSYNAIKKMILLR